MRLFHTSKKCVLSNFPRKIVVKLDNENDRKRIGFDIALDTRKFEIDLYWKRAAYFWAFIASTFAGYFVVFSAKDIDIEDKEKILFLLNCLGMFATWIWFLVLKGSKYWQENWEQQVGDREKEVCGFVFNNVLVVEKSCLLSLNAYPYSVSKLNMILSQFILAIWFFLLIENLNISFQLPFSYFKFILTVILIFFMIYSYCQGRSSFFGKVIKHNDKNKNFLTKLIAFLMKLLKCIWKLIKSIFIQEDSVDITKKYYNFKKDNYTDICPTKRSS